MASRLLIFSRANAGRRRARECFQVAPSLEKIELPSKGMKVARRACVRSMLVGTGVLVHSVLCSVDLPVLSRIPRDSEGQGQPLCSVGTSSFCCRSAYRELSREHCLHVCRFASKDHGSPVYDLIKAMRISTPTTISKEQALNETQKERHENEELTVFLSVCTFPFKFSSKMSSSMSSPEESARLHRTFL